MTCLSEPARVSGRTDAMKTLLCLVLDEYADAGVTEEVFRSRSNAERVVAAREAFAFVARHGLGVRPYHVTRFLGSGVASTACNWLRRAEEKHAAGELDPRGERCDEVYDQLVTVARLVLKIEARAEGAVTA